MIYRSRKGRLYGMDLIHVDSEPEIQLGGQNYREESRGSYIV
jgi:hypothetical protein